MKLTPSSFFSRYTALLITALLLATSCTTPSPSSTAPDDFMRFTNWWNFYERGRDRLQENRVQEAAEDFERCLGLRKGARFSYPKPAWRIRTYGLHFQENYFPNRELGICYLLLGEEVKATEFLSRSLNQLPSSRAKYYYNKAVSAGLQAANTPAPTITLEPAESQIWVTLRNYTLKGQAAAAGHIPYLKIGQEEQWIEWAEKTRRFKQVIPLKSGPNPVTVTVRDLLGQEKTITQTVHADWLPPAVFIQNQRIEQGHLILEAVCRDNDQIHAVTLDHVSQPMAGGSPSTVQLSLSIPETSGGMLRITDRAGNALEVDLWAQYRSEQAKRYTPIQFADARAGVKDAGSPAAKAPPAESGPVIDLKNLPSEVTVYQPYLYIDANITSPSGIQSILVNQVPWNMLPAKGSTAAHFNYLLDLPDGTNTFTLSVLDLKGQRSDQHIRIYRKEPEFLWARHRMRASIIPVITPERDWAGEYLRLMMETFFQNKPSGQSARFFLLPTDQAVWEELLTQQQLSLSDLADDRVLTTIRTASPAELFIKPHLFSDRGGITIRSKVVRNDSGQVLFAEDVYSESEDDDLDHIIRGLVSKVERRFPLARGTIDSVDKQQATVLFEHPQDLFPGFRFLVIQANGAGLEAGTLIKQGDENLELVVTKARATQCAGKFYQKEGTILIQPGDYVYAR